MTRGALTLVCGMAASGLAGACRKEPNRAAPAPAPPVRAAPAALGSIATGLGTGATLVGRVVTLGGGGGEKPDVIIVDLGSGATFEGVKPGATGNFAAEVAPGRYALTARLAGFDCDASEVDALDRQGVELVLFPAGIRPPRAITPAARVPAELEVTLLGIDGQPAAGAWAWAWVEPERGASHHEEARADLKGVARFARLPPGTITVGADHPSAGILDGEIVERVAKGLTTARLSLKLGGSLQGHVTDAQGKYLGDFPVSLSGEPVPVEGGPMFDSTRTQLTDPTGAFRIHGLRRGRFAIEAGWLAATPSVRYRFGAHPNPRRMGMPPRPKPLEVRGDDVIEMDAVPGQHAGGLVFVMRPADAVVTGRVEEGGRPVGGALVEAFQARAAGRSLPASVRLAAALSDAEGRFRLERLPHDRKLRLVAVKHGAEGGLAEVAGGAIDARIVLQPGKGDGKPGGAR